MNNKQYIAREEGATRWETRVKLHIKRIAVPPKTVSSITVINACVSSCGPCCGKAAYQHYLTEIPTDELMETKNDLHRDQ